MSESITLSGRMPVPVVILVKKHLEEGSMPASAIAKIFATSTAKIFGIKHGRIYRYVSTDSPISPHDLQESLDFLTNHPNPEIAEDLSTALTELPIGTNEELTEFIRKKRESRSTIKVTQTLRPTLRTAIKARKIADKAKEALNAAIEKVEKAEEAAKDAEAIDLIQNSALIQAEAHNTKLVAEEAAEKAAAAEKAVAALEAATNLANTQLS